MPLEVVLQVVMFDLSESVMKCGSHVMWQHTGVPMGSYLSALLASITVAFAEHQFYSRLPPSVAERVEGVRYADDGVVVIVEWAGVRPASQVFQHFVDDCYPKPLELEVEQHSGQFDLLECVVFATPDGAGWTTHRSKNWAGWLRTGRCRFRVWTGGDSWSGAQRGILLGALLRVDDCCTKRSEVFSFRLRAILRVLVEAQHHGGYSMKAVRDCVRHLAKFSSSTASRAATAWWSLVLRFLTGVQSTAELYSVFLEGVLRVMPKLV